jgi:Mg2+-importing ATPase
MSVILDVMQERRAVNAAEHLREQVSLSAKTLRDGRPVDVPAAELVPGDVVLLAAGDLVPADSRLIEARDLYVDEALLTGESYPAEKDATPAAAGAPRETAFPSNLVFMGSSVVSGTAKALVVATGRNAQLGSIARSLQKPAPPTAFEVGIRDFGQMIAQLTVFLVLFVLLVNLLFHRPLLESFTFSLALAVGLTPELLPMIVSVTLAHGALRLSRKQVIVKRLSAIDDLGSMDVFCSDKTGTLTEARIKLVRELDLDGRDSGAVMQMAQLNAAFETGLKSPLDDAIQAAGKIDLTTWRKIDEVPFDFERRRVSVLVEGGGRRLIIVKGAPEDILGHAAHYEQQGAPPRPLDVAARKTAEATFNGLGAEGYRVLGVAWREVEADRQHANVADEADLTFAGFLAFLDPPKAGAREALTALANLGVGLKVVTGDNEQVTRHVCGELGLKVAGTLTGPEIAALTDEALLARLDNTTLFCRATPPLKSRIIATLRRKGHVVGYLGDGINDAPSLHAADVGFSVDTGVDVAKDAAAMILLRKDLGVLAEGVREGRKTFVNILKYIMMATSSNFGNMFSMAAGVLFLPFLPMLPTQILLNNLLYDLSEMTIPLDRVSDSMVAKPRAWDLDFVRKFTFVFGPLSSIFDFVTFGLLLWVFRADERLFHTSWFVESLSTQILVIFIIRTTDPFRDPPHPALAASSLLAFAIAVALPYSPLAPWLGFVPVPAALMGALALVTIAYLVLVYVMKRWFFARYQLE